MLGVMGGVGWMGGMGWYGEEVYIYIYICVCIYTSSIHTFLIYRWI